MKRSEMVSLIYETIADSDAHQYGETLNLADRILEAIENVGMLPPMAHNTPIVDDAEGHVYLTVGCVNSIFVWEPEEEL